MMRLLFILALGLLMQAASAQSEQTTKRRPISSAYLELGGPAFLGAVNLDFLVPLSDRNAIGPRIGIGRFPDEVSTQVGLTYTKRIRETSRYWDWGIGVNWLQGRGEKWQFDFDGSNQWGYLAVGMRWQTPKGMFYRANVQALIFDDFPFPLPWPGFSIGRVLKY